MRVAVIDCGTNTFNLLIVETLSGNKYERVYNTRIPVKLGEGGINKGFIADAPFERGINALITFNLIAKEYEVERIITFATSAIRDAANSAEFVSTALDRSGIQINVIDGNREAELIYLGCKEALELNENNSLIMDIGGGSNEFIIANNSGVLWKHSFNLGAARLLERFTPSDPISEKELETMNQYLSENLKPLMQAVEQFKPCELIGTSGAFDSVVEMINGEMGGEPLTYHKTGYDINLKFYKRLSQKIRFSTIAERKCIKGLTPVRFDMIVISCMLIDHVLNSYHIGKMRVSTYSLKEGALMDFIKNVTNH